MTDWATILILDGSCNRASYDDYYPYGMVMEGRSGNNAQGDTRYKYTGKERDVESQYEYCGRSYERAKLMELVNDGFRTNGPGSDAQQTCFVDGQRPYNPMTMLLDST